MPNIVIPTLQTITANLTAGTLSVFPDADTSPDSPMGQLIEVLALDFYNQYQDLEAAYNSQSVTTAQDEDLDFLYANINVYRQNGTFSTISGVTLTGTDTTVIPAGSVCATASGNLFHSTEDATISGTTATVDFVSNTLGNIPVAVGELNTIVTPIAGWSAVTNPTAAIAGLSVQTDASLRQDGQNLINQFSLGYLGVIKAAIFKVPSVVDVQILENDTGSTASPIPIPPNTFDIIVDYSDLSQNLPMANSIFTAKGAAGTYADGSLTIETQSVTDIAGQPHTITWNKATQTQIYIDVSLNEISYYGVDITTVIQNNLVNYVNEVHRIGGLLVWSKVLAQIATIDTGILIETMTMGTSPSPVDSLDLQADLGEIFYLEAGNINVTVL